MCSVFQVVVTMFTFVLLIYVDNFALGLIVGALEMNQYYMFPVHTMFQKNSLNKEFCFLSQHSGNQLNDWVACY